MPKTIAKSLLALTAISAVHAHTVFTGLYVNGVGLGDATGIRMSDIQGAEGSPVHGVTSNEIACNVHGDRGAPRVLSIKALDTLTFEWRSWADDASKVAIDPTHKGPCSVYMKKVDSAINDPGYGEGWFKVWQDGYDSASGLWCTDKLNANRAHVSISIPSWLQGGYYLIRPEILSLHAAVSPNYDPQFYVGCAQVFLRSDGDLLPTRTVSIPGHVSANDPALTYNLYVPKLQLPYPMPGPDVPTFASTGKGKEVMKSSQLEGQRPTNCVLVAGNFCFNELQDYQNEDGCWAAGRDCWEQNQNCWKRAGLAAVHYCLVWENSKCKVVEATCRNKQFPGPPNKGQDLTPRPSTIAI